ncbi:MAG: TolC family protein [Chthoniobacterales bacterium]
MPRAALLKRLALWFFAGSLLLCGQSAHPITLEAALARTLEKNPAIQEAKARLEEAAGRRLVLRASALPDALVIVPGGLQGGHRAGEKSVQPFTFARGYLNQPLFNAGIPPAYRRGNIEQLLAQQRLNLAVMDQLHTARIAFYTACYEDAMRALGEAQRERLEGNAKTQSDRYQAGQSDRVALTIARILEQEVKPRVEESRRRSSGALLQLAQTMGDDLGSGATLPSAEGRMQFAAADLNVETEAAAALRRRPDLEIARLLIRAAGEDQRILEAAYYPALNATVSGDYIPVSEIRRGSEGSARRSDDIISSEARAGAAYSWRVVDNGRVGGAVLRQRAARAANEAVLAKLEGDVPRELTRIQHSLRALSARHESLEKAVRVSEETVTDVLNNLTEGLSSQLEYRTAENSFLQTKAGVLTVAFEQKLALAELDRLTGRYFQFSDDTSEKLH